MKVATRLIFGIRTSKDLTLTVTVGSPLPASPPDLVITTRGQEDSKIPCRDNQWVATLGEGDHVICMPVPDGSLDGKIECDLSPSATVVTHGNDGRPVAYTSNVVSFDDPKYPWPPPVRTPPAGPLPDAAWFTTTLATLNARIAVLRGLEHPSVSVPKPTRRDRSS